jgi:hypothetical protein
LNNTNLIPLNLEEVTLVCFDTRNIEAAIKSMEYSLSQTNFGESILFTTKVLCSNKVITKTKKLGIKLEMISEIKSITEYSYFILANLERYINTKFCLVTQWDGWVINSQKWNSEFLNYDYIGAIWPDYSSNQIGNGGFSLRSKKLLRSTRDLIENDPKMPINLIEDNYICRKKRGILEKKYQIKFSTTKLANSFSIEGNKLPLESFGFHGMSNFHSAINEDLELKKLIDIIIDENFKNRESYDLTKRLVREDRLDLAMLIIKRRFKVNGFSRKHVKLNFFLLTRKFFSLLNL